MSSKVCMILVWFFVICLLVVGLVMVSSTAAWAEETKHPYEPLFKQTSFACAGLVGAMILSRIDYRIWRKYIWWILGGACFLLVLCYVPGIGKEINGERRWITIGMQFQPSECAKLCMMMALANWLALYRDRTTSFWWGFVMPGLIFGIPLALILFEKDMGTSVALALAAFCVMFVAGTRKIYLGGAFALAGTALYVLVQSNANRLERFLAWKDLDAHRLGAGLQQYRASIALSRGGLDGVGLGNSAEKHGTLPFAHTDFIFAPLGEEFGFYGTMFVLLCYFLMTYAGIGVAMQCRDTYGRFLAVGIVAIIFCPAILNIAVVTNAVPNSGLPLPFISFGGTNLVFTLAALGMLTSIQRFSTGAQPNCEITRKDERSIDVRL